MFKVTNLVKKYGDNIVLDNINLSIEKDEKVVIIGPSGSGKSTLLRCLNSLETISSGEILFEGIDITLSEHNKNRSQIGMVFQSFNLFKNLTVIENITLAPIKRHLMSRDIAYMKAREYLKHIGMQDKENSYPSDLSGGQQQRVAIIRSLMVNPKVILFDEPTSALDAEMIDEVLNLMKEVSKSITMVVVTHELNFAKNFATKVIFMDKGKIVEEGPPDKIFGAPSTERLKEFLNV